MFTRMLRLPHCLGYFCCATSSKASAEYAWYVLLHMCARTALVAMQPTVAKHTKLYVNSSVFRKQSRLTLVTSVWVSFESHDWSIHALS